MFSALRKIVCGVQIMVSHTDCCIYFCHMNWSPCSL